MFIIMNTALGEKGTGPVASSTSFPQYFYIDYVRVYQK
jgi:beta-glucanase (GH16 family)